VCKSGVNSEIEDAKMTDRLAEHRIRMTVEEARALGEAAMRGAGYGEDEARILTDHVLDAALCGYEYSGLPKLLRLLLGFGVVALEGWR
jgi:hypothetical protein